MCVFFKNVRRPVAKVVRQNLLDVYWVNLRHPPYYNELEQLEQRKIGNNVLGIFHTNPILLSFERTKKTERKKRDPEK